jgi:predicted transcriptional regulator
MERSGMRGLIAAGDTESRIALRSIRATPASIMASTTDTIEVDRATADTLKARAAKRGISVADLLAEIVRESGPVALDAAEMAELDRRWAKVKAGETTVRHDEVVRWLNTWGTPAFKPWHNR